MAANSAGRLTPNGAALTAFIVVLLLLPILVGAAIVDHRDEVKVEKRELAFEASEQAEVLNNYFLRARSLTQVLARNPAFRQFYEQPGSLGARVRAQGPLVQEANSTLAYLEDLFPGAIGEACFIDVSGPENARAVKGSIAPLSELSPDETGARFFKPTFALPPGHVYQAEPYLSPDTNEWVISNSTPVPGTPRAKQAIVHFEITLESFRQAALETSGNFDVQIIDAKTGAVLVDTKLRQRPGGKLGRPSDSLYKTEGAHRHARFDPANHPHLDLPTLIERGASKGTLTVSGHRAAYQRLPQHANNANDWVVVAKSRKTATIWLDSIGLLEAGSFFGLLVLLVFAGASLLLSQKDLTAAALSDPLTGLGNRRRLLVELERSMGRATQQRPLALFLFDLDGFKSYNDAFGHAAGDVLLARFGKRLERALSDRAAAYRMGGDEFCVVAQLSRPGEEEKLRDDALEALAESGEAFNVTSSYGCVLVPVDARDASEALRVADQRMYAEKAMGRASASRQSTDVLVRVLMERNAELGSHVTGVAEHAAAVARSLGMSQEDISDIERAGALHDIGKVAIPEAILQKAGPLDDDEWSFVRRHTLIGERILAAAPSLARVVKLVRWSHERFDSSGYPDGLSGHEIPIGARILAVCAAFEAMTSARPYRSAMSEELALEELRACSGTQFDPRIVDAFIAVLRARAASPSASRDQLG